MSNLKAVFWDVDGTLAETEMNGHRMAFNKAFATKHIDWFWDTDKYIDLLEITGGKQRIIEYSRRLKYNLSLQTAEELHQLKQAYYIKYVQDKNMKWRPGVLRLIKELKSHNIDQWIVTTSRKESVAALLNNKFEIHNNPFQGCITYEDVSSTKPSPEAYLKAIDLSGYSNRNIIAIEDSYSGLVASTKAQLKCLLTPSDWDKRRDSALSMASASFESLGDEDHPSIQLAGPPCECSIITVEYLSNLLASAPL